MRLKKIALAATVFLTVTSTHALEDYGVSAGNEELLLQGFESIAEQKFDTALVQMKELVDIRPDFRLAQLVYADLLIAQASPLAQVGSTFTGEQKVKLDGLIAEAKSRIKLRKEKPAPDLIPKDIIKLSDTQKHVIVQDMALNRLFLFENRNGVPHLIKDYYASHGRGGVGKWRQGDKKSPIGVYFTTGRLLDKDLPQRYGAGALPLNYPNAWDYRLNKTGNGIWLHGSPVDTYSRPPLASLGCLSLTNPDFQEVDRLVNKLDTPVILGENLEWLSRAQWKAQRENAINIVRSWEADWESLDYTRYIENYSTKFNDGKKKYTAFAAQKKRVTKSKTFIELDLSDLSIYSYPDKDLMVVSFMQEYVSNNYKGANKKRQYWQRENNSWKIAYEGAPSNGIP